MTEERVVVHLRAHASRLLPPAVALLVLAPVTGAVLGRTEGTASWVVGALAAVLGVRLVLWPFLRWWTTTYELTSRRASLRWGVLSRHGRDVPWRHVADVALDRSLRQRLTGCGTVVLLCRDDNEMVLADVPQPERLWRAAADLAAAGTAVRP
ncbi:MAG TPA: PH domain-containing protein [Actinomycetales bacterium]|nr:PH domain-containing protein [Actinomycetales bacterium]